VWGPRRFPLAGRFARVYNSTAMSEGAKPGRPPLTRVWIAFLIVVGILILGDLNRRMSDARRLERDAAGLATEIAALDREQLRLQTQIAQADSDVVVERWARMQAKLARDGEVLIVPVPVGGYVEPALPTPTPFPMPPTRLEVWQQLLFGD
jgi:cell division protein FtsB